MCKEVKCSVHSIARIQQAHHNGASVLTGRYLAGFWLAEGALGGFRMECRFM